ncbi:helix-turn-helix domain-containing protein [Konateibacter massiliensis]|uniref:helix-turn-helix domain-containing protein n=1 Tax=Konateibacter massiliensis TaxID=2002841 RepID=UPI000C151CE6|nr:helix-turn-helix transcriptional regulator [Konateibacter massiliensis]
MRLNIKDKLDNKGITRYELAKRIDVTYKTVDKIYNGESTSIKLEILEAICLELECTPNEIMVSDDPRLNRLMAYFMLNKQNKKDDSE